MTTLLLEIVTPTGTEFSGAVEMVTLPTATGQIGIYPLHVPLLTRMVPGEMVVRRGSRDEFLAVGQGLVEITADRISIVTDMAIAVDKIDEARVEAARRQAEARLRDKISDEEVATVNASLARSLAQLRVRARHRP